MRTEIQIANRRVGPGHPLFVMAECGVTCNYDLAITRELIDVVREAGADAIKLIFWFPDEIMGDRSVVYTYKTADGGQRSENMYEMLQRLRFTLEQWQEVKAYADSRGVILFATVNSPTGIEWAERLQLPAYKLSSWDYNYTPLWRRIAALGKPMLIDTGPVTLAELAAVMQLVQEQGNDQCVLVHTVHTDLPREINMRSIPFLRAAFGAPAGYSSRDQRSETDLLAVALGADMIEKRLTLKRTLPGHHHALSLEPKEFIDWTRMVRDAQASLGVAGLMPSPGDLAERKRWFRHLAAHVDLPAGAVLTEEMLAAKRGEHGVSPEHLHLFVGRTLRRALKRDEPLGWQDV